MKRWTLFWVALAVGLALTFALWQFGIGFLILPLFLPVFFWPRGWTRACPQCGHTTSHPAERFCPVDGERLKSR